MNPDLATRLSDLNQQIATLEGDVGDATREEQELIGQHQEAGTLTSDDAIRAIHTAGTKADELRTKLADLQGERERVRSVIQRTKPHGSTGRALAVAEQGTVAAALYDQHGQWAFNVRREYLERETFVRRLKSGRSDILLHATTSLQEGVGEDVQLRPPLPLPVQQPRVIDLITVGATQSDVIRWQRLLTRTDNTAPTARGTAYSQSELAFQQVTTGVRDIGTYVTLHEDNIADAPFMETIVETELRDMVLRAVESLILAGDGSGTGAGTEFVGILDGSSGVGTTNRVTDEFRLDFLHRLITVVGTQLFEDTVNGIAMHPLDWHTTIIEKPTNAGYLASNPLNAGPRNLWGVPVALTTNIPQGTVLVGDFRRGAKLWIRRGVDLQVSNEHSTYFTERQVALRADIRAAFYVQMPSAFRIGTF